MAVIALEFKSSFGMYSSFKPRAMLLPRSCKMGPLLPGAILMMVVTAQQFKVISGMFGGLRAVA